jgi:hypothetical protein
MARSPSRFRQGDVTRAVKGAIAAGVEVREVLVDTDGKIRVIAGKPVEAIEFNALDRWMATHARETQGH